MWRSSSPGNAAWAAAVAPRYASLLTGLVQSLGTQWGLFRHYWVLLKLLINVFAAIILLLHIQTVSALARLAAEADNADLPGAGGELLHAGIGVLLLLVATVLAVYKPRGMNRYGWRKP